METETRNFETVTVGRWYRTRHGMKAKVTGRRVHSAAFPYEAQLDGQHYHFSITADGYYLNSGDPRERDFVCELSPESADQPAVEPSVPRPPKSILQLLRENT